MCPGCGNPVSPMERLTGKCSKDNLPLDQPRGGIHITFEEAPDA